MNKESQETRNPLKLAVFGSGKGSNCQSIIDAIQGGTLNAEIVCVLSDVEDAYIIERALDHGIPAQFVDASPYKTKLDGDAEQAYIEKIQSYGAQVVCLAGFMRMIKPALLSAFPRAVVNIHPSLLPAFPGMESWKQALTYGAKVAGCTVHFVDEGMDTGPIIVQRPVPILENDTAESLHARIQIEEHVAYPEALQLIAKGQFSVEGRRVRL